MRRKGQWLLAGAILLITMISTSVISNTQVKIGQDVEPWQKYIFQNLELESSPAINSMIQENATSKNIEGRSRDYLDFLRSFGNSHGMDVSAYFIVGLPAGGDINVSVINFGRNELQDIEITVNGTTKTIASLSDRHSATIAFPAVPDYFAVEYGLTEVNATGGTETESGNFETIRKVFSIVKMRVASKDGSQIWQSTDWTR